MKLYPDDDSANQFIDSVVEAMKPVEEFIRSIRQGLVDAGWGDVIGEESEEEK